MRPLEMTDVGLGVLLDRVCNEMLGRDDPLGRGRRLMVHPLVYRCVAESRPQEVARRLPLMLLGLELAPSDEVPPSGFKIV
jgi:hypothetical protein